MRCGLYQSIANFFLSANMAEILKHECGVAMIRLRKPIEYYRKRYGSATWALDRLYLLMEKQDMNMYIANEHWVVMPLPQYLTRYNIAFRVTMRILQLPMRPRHLSGKYTWDIFDIPRQAVAECRMCIPFYGAITGNRATYCCAATSI